MLYYTTKRHTIGKLRMGNAQHYQKSPTFLLASSRLCESDYEIAKENNSQPLSVDNALWHVGSFVLWRWLRIFATCGFWERRDAISSASFEYYLSQIKFSLFMNALQRATKVPWTVLTKNHHRNSSWAVLSGLILLSRCSKWSKMLKESTTFGNEWFYSLQNFVQ